MAKILSAIKNHARLTVQICFAALTNGYVAGFAKGTIFTGPTKALCVPGLNCYSCPGALGSCPIGALQAVITDGNFKFTFYVAGLLMLFGATMGRFVCGFLCPFGLLQDLLYKIPIFKKLKALPGDRYLKKAKYAVLAIFVVLLPLTVLDIIGQGQPWFCEYVCPSGALFAGVPLVLATPALQAVIGWRFWLKIGILAVTLLVSIAVYRPFCRYLCPLGAIYGMFNRVALYRYSVDKVKCTECGQCQKACKIDIKTFVTPNSAECIRCGDCIKACPVSAISTTFSIKKAAVKKTGKSKSQD